MINEEIKRIIERIISSYNMFVREMEKIYYRAIQTIRTEPPEKQRQVIPYYYKNHNAQWRDPYSYKGFRRHKPP